MKKVVLILCVVVFLSSGVLIAININNTVEAQQEVQEVKHKNGKELDVKKLHAENPDIIGWLTVPDTNIDYPVMLTPEDEEFYLHRDFNKEWKTGGSLFMDTESIASKNQLIYGHHMQDGTMFQDLMKYKNEEFYKEHKLFVFKDIGNVDHYFEVAATCHTRIYNQEDTIFKYYMYAMVDNENYKEYIDGITSIRDYDTKVKPESNLMTLSTCSYHTKNGRFVVVGTEVDPPKREFKERHLQKSQQVVDVILSNIESGSERLKGLIQ